MFSSEGQNHRLVHEEQGSTSGLVICYPHWSIYKLYIYNILYIF